MHPSTSKKNLCEYFRAYSTAFRHRGQQTDRESVARLQVIPVRSSDSYSEQCLCAVLELAGRRHNITLDLQSFGEPIDPQPRRICSVGPAGKQASKQAAKKQCIYVLAAGCIPPFSVSPFLFLLGRAKALAGEPRNTNTQGTLPYLTLCSIVCGYVPYVCTYKAGERGDERAVVWCGVVGSTYLDLPTLGTLHVLNSLTYM